MACEQKVRVWYDEKDKAVKYELLCSGKCNDGDAKPCELKKKKEVEPGKTTNIEYCACDGGKGRESDACHIVLCTVEETEERFYRCDFSETDKCRKGEECLPVPVRTKSVPIKDKQGHYTGKMGKFVDYQCQCKAPD